MPPWVYALLSVIAVSLASLIGLVTVSWSPERLERTLFFMVSLAVGAMLGNAFLHLLPPAFSASPESLQPALLVLAGIVVFFVMEKFLRWRHEHMAAASGQVLPVGYLSLFADGLHNFFDGVLIGASYLVSLPTGLGTTLAILLHEIPQEIGDFGILIHAGFPAPRALMLNFLTALSAVAGAIVGLCVGHVVHQLPILMLPFAAGGFIYIAGSDLVPELHKERDPRKSLVQLAAMGAGIGAMVLMRLLE